MLLFYILEPEVLSYIPNSAGSLEKGVSPAMPEAQEICL